MLTYHGLDLLPVFEVDTPAGDQSNLLFVAPTFCAGQSNMRSLVHLRVGAAVGKCELAQTFVERFWVNEKRC